MINQFFLRLYQRITNNHWVKTAISIHIQNKITTGYFFKKGIELKDFKVFIPKNQYLFFLQGYRLAKAIQTITNATFNFTNQQLEITINNIIHIVNSYDELFILHEIYAEKCYNIILPNQKFNVLDIGANVGFSCLFFAQNKNINKIFGFEPFEFTYLQAQKNIKNNPILQSKIQLYNFGLGHQDYVTSLKFDATKQGKAGLFNYPHNQNKSNLPSVTIEIKNAQQQISQILRENFDTDFILKVDCEGGEFDIFKVLNKSILSRIKVIIMEWHWKSPKSLVDKLHDNCFIIINTQIDKHSGLIYAFQTSKS